MEIGIRIGHIASGLYVGKDQKIGCHIFHRDSNNHTAIKDENLNGKSILKPNTSFLIKHNTVSEYTVLEEI